MHLYYTSTGSQKQSLWISTGTRNSQIPVTLQPHDQLNLLIAPLLGLLYKAGFDVCVRIVEAAKSVGDSFEVRGWKWELVFINNLHPSIESLPVLKIVLLSSD